MRAIIIIAIISLAFNSPGRIDKDIPKKNLDFIKFLEKNGSELAKSYTETNCVQFMDKALKRFLIVVPRETQKRIYINQSIDNINKLLAKNDTSIVSGVCAALVDANMAEWVKPENAKRGDIIQYWSTEGFTNGHCGIICGEDSNGYVLYGSHPDSKGFGKMNAMNKNMKMKIFIVRLK